MDLYNSFLLYFDKHVGLQPMLELIFLIILLWEKGIGSFCKGIYYGLCRKVKCIFGASKMLYNKIIEHLFLFRVMSHIYKNGFRYTCDCFSLRKKSEEHRFHVVKNGSSYQIIKSYYKISPGTKPGQIQESRVKGPELVFEISPWKKDKTRFVNIKRYRSKFKVKGIDIDAAIEFFKFFEE